MTLICGKVRPPSPSLAPNCPSLLPGGGGWLGGGAEKNRSPLILVALPSNVKWSFHDSAGNEMLRGPLKLRV